MHSISTKLLHVLKMHFYLQNFSFSHVLSIGLFTIASLFITPSKAFANQGRCTFHDANMNWDVTMPLPTSLDFCSFAIRGASNSSPLAFGFWSGYTVGVNRAGQVYLLNNKKWQYVGIISERPLSDRCVEGDTKACEKWGRNMDRMLNACRRGERVMGLCNDPAPIELR